MGSIYKIGSFNTHNFSGKTDRDVNKMANIIKNENFDIVALQEILDEVALESLLKRLPHWVGKQISPASFVKDAVDDKERKNAGKGFAFLWNSNRMRECSKEGEPMLADHNFSKGALARTPLYGRFSPSGLQGGAFIEIRLINIHIVWGKGNSLTDKEIRLMEFNYIVEKLYTYYSKHRYGNNMPGYTIIIGDYNLTKSWLFEKNLKIENIEMVTHQEEKTTISDERYANDYDHFSYDENLFSGVMMTNKKIDSVLNYYNGSFSKHKEVLSDHVPIKIELDINPPIKETHNTKTDSEDNYGFFI